MKSRQVPFLHVVGAAIALASCGGGSGASTDGGRRADVGADDATGSFQCGSDAGVEPSLSQVALDGGVGIEQYVRAMAIARCNYWNRCVGLAPYIANECVDALVALGTWGYWDCPSKSSCGGEFASYSSAALVQAVHAGIVQYDPPRAGQCVAALLAEGCGDVNLIETIPACTGVFTCAAGADGGGGGAADGGADAGFSCMGLLPSWTPLQTCSIAADCAGATSPQGPYCVAGFCSASPCGLSSYRGCTAYAQVGQPCLNDAISIVHLLFITDPATETAAEFATETCAPGLACKGAVDGGVGTCVTPQDTGGACASTADCSPGLVCACGVCQILPSTGPCADGLCKAGVAYCDFDSNVCKPVVQRGGSCNGLPPNACAPGLQCGSANVCNLR